MSFCWDLEEDGYLEQIGYGCKRTQGFLGDAVVKKSACQCRRCRRQRFDSWVWKISWKRKWQPTPVFLPVKIPWTEEPGRYSPWGGGELGMTAQHST